MNIQNKIFQGIIQAHENRQSSSMIGCDGYWFDNWKEHITYVGKYMLTKEEKDLLTDDEKNLLKAV